MCAFSIAVYGLSYRPALRARSIRLQSISDTDGNRTTTPRAASPVSASVSDAFSLFLFICLCLSVFVSLSSSVACRPEWIRSSPTLARSLFHVKINTRCFAQLLSPFEPKSRSTWKSCKKSVGIFSFPWCSLVSIARPHAKICRARYC